MRLCGIWIVLVAVSLASCASYSFDKVDADAAAGRYDAAIKKLDKDKSLIYGGDAVRYYLDTGMLAHFAAQYEVSAQRLQKGDRAIESAFTKSVTQNAASYITNDTTIEYTGEDYEDLYVNIFNALNYYHQDDIEGALVEIRRMEEKLKKLAVRYNVVEEQLARENREAAKKANVKVNFSNSALARYLGMLFYRAQGSDDDVRIDRDWLKRAFADQRQMYPHPAPSSIEGELDIPRGMARVNVLAFCGLAPVKGEEVTRIPLVLYNSWIKIALPVMRARPSKANTIEVSFGDAAKIKLELLEDISRIAEETFKKHLGIIEAKTIIRATLKSTAASGFMLAGNGENNAALGIAGIAMQIFAEASERADTRGTRYFPARAYTGAVNLTPGNYQCVITYYNNAGQNIASFSKDITVKTDALNLIESCYLK